MQMWILIAKEVLKAQTVPSINIKNEREFDTATRPDWETQGFTEVEVVAFLSGMI